ncbi:MAG: flagellar protein FlaG [Bryobacteraceae bacterium]|nr:flagellar protein FlaG [Bryobacteraceae bacterium]
MDINPVNSNPALPVSAQIVSPELQAQNRELIEAVKALNGAEFFGQNNELTFVFDRTTRRPLVRIVDRETREVVRQIPPEYALRMAEDLGIDR